VAGTPAIAWKFTVDCPGVVITVGGTVTSELLALTEMLNALEGAGLRVMAQLAVELGDNCAGAQVNAFTWTLALKESDALI
jgi:hypothetical protein